MSLSPEERAAAVLYYHQHGPYNLDYLIADAIHAAILEERERAAQICDAYIAELIAKSPPRDPERDKDGNYFDAVCWHVNVIQSRIRS